MATQPRTSSLQWIYGRHAVAAALANPARSARRVVALGESAEGLKALLATARARVPPSGVEILERRFLEALLPPGAVHQGVALAVEPLPAPDLEEILRALEKTKREVILILDQVTDPHNIGAILRSAAAFSARAVITLEHGAPPVTGVLAKAASGALETVALLRVTNLARALDRLKEEGFWCVGLEEEGTQVLAALDLPPLIALVLGGEGSGLRRLTRERCDFLARLPTAPDFPSLNVSNAAAIALYELARGRYQDIPIKMKAPA
ncbi:MAG TPA: 23S rRNA (guanosine(2251)-2'-O)-methyltransferase RlmB [Stellaceae bacterium]|nr:23S rRNA (guanosine(2251)-2'-O)-methyltransferase RlmB [Stellaceae bacterium]